MSEELFNLEESFSTSTVMNVNELRLLYQGRLDVYATFTDDVSRELVHNDLPICIKAHPINDIVGRKVKTSKFYAFVFRLEKNKSGNRFINDIRTYDSRDLDRDLSSIREMTTMFDIDTIEQTIERSLLKSSLKSHFQKIWSITKDLAETKGRSAPIVWRRIFVRMGYNGVADNGSGLFGKRGEPIVLIFNLHVEELDIVPIQKTRRDQRQRVVNQVDRYVRKLATARNRVAKRRFIDRG